MTKNMKIKDISDRLLTIKEPNDPFLDQCKMDDRKGVSDLLLKWKKSYQKELQLQNVFKQMCTNEIELRKQGYSVVAGIDEVGRGPLAGPVVACAVVLPEDFYCPGLTDSKQLSETKRNHFYEIIRDQAVAIGTGIIDNGEIDKINIYEATKKAMLTAVTNLGIVPDYLLIDAMKLDIPVPQLSMIKGDSKSISIAAASIMAKVTRDRMMKEYAVQYPHYAFEKNMGYGTKAHLEGLDEFGITPWHRRSFSPVKEMSGRNKTNGFRM
ncbi:ribonuclease HII [Peribacillus loiseleuriae]|uniref:ribonuclease HII n=1 Tax=Peribacillus loiseleuriae TaxID=1679170 RepID=UPI0037F12D35